MTDELAEHPVPDDVDGGWLLTVTGDVETTVNFDAEDLSELGTRRYVDDFTCLEGWSADEVVWEGVPFERLLKAVEPTDDTRYAVVESREDGYRSAFALGEVSDALIATYLDDEPLPVKHGGPYRLVPTDDAECYESVKWVDTVRFEEGSPDDSDDTAERIATERL